MEAYGFEFPAKRRVLPISDFWNFVDFDSSVTVDALSVEFNSLCVYFLIETLMKEVKNVVMEKHEFGNQDESILITFFRGLGPSRF